MDLEGHLTEYAHLAQQQAEQQIQSHQNAYVGYIQEWNVESNQVRVLDPLNSNGPNGQPMVSAPMPLFTSFAGIANGNNPINPDVEQYGFQQGMFGGGSTVNPQGGEQVLVLQINAEIGHQACAFLMYNNGAQPPGANIRIIGGQLQSGELLYVSPTGTLVWVDVNGNIKIITQLVPDADQNVTGNLQVASQGGIRLETTDGAHAPGAIEQGDIRIDAHRDIIERAQRDITLTATDRDITQTAGRDITMNAARRIDMMAAENIQAAADVNIQLAAGVNIVAVAANNASLSAGADLTLGAAAAMNVTAGGPMVITGGTTINVTATGNIEIVSAGGIELLATQINIGAIAEALFPLVTQEFLDVFNAHTHSGVATGIHDTTPPVLPVLPVYPIVTAVLSAG